MSKKSTTSKFYVHGLPVEITYSSTEELGQYLLDNFSHTEDEVAPEVDRTVSPEDSDAA